VTFGRWQKLAAATVPRRRGVLQARLADELITYPTGKSAMVYYDADEDLSLALTRLGAAIPPGADVLVRYAECPDPSAELHRKLDEVTRRFGAPPVWMTP
jgi:hypothetical protein